MFFVNLAAKTNFIRVSPPGWCHPGRSASLYPLFYQHFIYLGFLCFSCSEIAFLRMVAVNIQKKEHKVPPVVTLISPVIQSMIIVTLNKR